MSDNISAETLLSSQGIKPTSSRILVLRTLLHSDRPLSLSEIEAELVSVDKSQISRALSLFMEHDLLHRIEDWSGASRYEVCHSHEDGRDNDEHVHFYCEKCGRLLCLEDIMVPVIPVPEGYTLEHTSLVVSGICPDCNKSNQGR